MLSFLSGALEWRPSTFITGDKATGKTTVQKVFKGVLGGWLVQAADTTAAGIYQRVKHDALPVSVDELESERDPVKQKNILKIGAAFFARVIDVAWRIRRQGQ